MVFYRLRKWLLVRKMPVFSITKGEADILRDVLYKPTQQAFLCWRLLSHTESSDYLRWKLHESMEAITLDTHLGICNTPWWTPENRILLRNLWIEKLLSENGEPLV